MSIIASTDIIFMTANLVLLVMALCSQIFIRRKTLGLHSRFMGNWKISKIKEPSINTKQDGVFEAPTVCLIDLLLSECSISALSP